MQCVLLNMCNVYRIATCNKIALYIAIPVADANQFAFVWTVLPDDTYN